MVAASASELLILICQLARCHIPQYGNLYQDCCENLISPKMKYCVLQCCIGHDLYTGLDAIQCNCMTAFAANTVTEYCGGKMDLKGNPLYFMFTYCSANIYGSTDI
jgi:hypothetical protein